MADQTVAAGYTRALLDYAVCRGANRQRLIEHSGINPNDLKEPDNRIPLANCVRLMNAAVALCNDPAFALRFGEALTTEDMGVALMIAGVAETVGEARTQMNRHSRLIRDDASLELVRDQSGVWLESTGDTCTGKQYLVEAGFAWTVRETRKMLEVHHQGRPFLKAIHFTHEEPGYRAEYDRVFAVPLVFSSDRNAMLIEEDFLSLRMPGSNPYVLQVLSKHAEALIERLENSKTIRGRVEGFLIPGLNTGDTAMQTVAGRMGLGRQTLFRKLKAEGVTFEKVLDDLRRNMAIHYLGEENVPVNKVAYLLGFSEPAAFSRAFKRWTGSSPRKMRDRP
jgi:AraC-like DNA-binding protein